MDSKYKRHLVTAALPYANGAVHIGHLAGVYVPADIYARFLRLQNKDVAFICGSDEHGVAISMKAKKEGITPQEVIDKYNKIIRISTYIPFPSVVCFCHTFCFPSFGVATVKCPNFL